MSSPDRGTCGGDTCSVVVFLCSLQYDILQPFFPSYCNFASMWRENYIITCSFMTLSNRGPANADPFGDIFCQSSLEAFFIISNAHLMVYVGTWPRFRSSFSSEWQKFKQQTSSSSSSASASRHNQITSSQSFYLINVHQLRRYHVFLACRTCLRHPR